MSTSSEAPQAGAGDRARCTPCRGTGKLISNLGGHAHEVTCRWCGGTGLFKPGLDAQDGEAAETSA
jgi:DnaJ-class molecular chaperone